MISDLRPKITMHLDDQCRWVFKTSKGNQMLVTFVRILNKQSINDRWDDVYECLNLSTKERHLITCRDFNKHFSTGSFYDLKKTALYHQHEIELTKGTLQPVIIHVDPL